jgi:hypothetical protein
MIHPFVKKLGVSGRKIGFYDEFMMSNKDG